jgi:hypothetical protein
MRVLLPGPLGARLRPWLHQEETIGGTDGER